MNHIQEISKLLEGSWRGKIGEDIIEEIWSQSSGNSIMGMFRWVKNSRTNFYGFILITEDSYTLKMKIKHFNEDFSGWEEKDVYVEYKLKEVSDTEIIFSSDDPSEKGQIIYKRPNPSELISILEMKDGKELKFHFTRC